MARMPDNFLDLTVTSPPYDNLRDYNGYSFPFEKIAKELYRVTKDGGVVVWVVGDATINGSETGTSFKQALFFKQIGFNLHDTMIYQRVTTPLTHKRYEQEFEYMFVFSKGKPTIFNPIRVEYTEGTQKRRNSNYLEYKHRNNNNRKLPNKKTELNYKGRIKGNVWKYKVGNNHSTKDKCAFKHPAIFPEALAIDHVLTWTNDGAIVYDPFMGSGTTAKACVLTNRNFIGSEISNEYCNIAHERIAQLKMF